MFGRAGARRGDAEEPLSLAEPAPSGSTYATKALKKFLATLKAAQAADRVRTNLVEVAETAHAASR